MHFSFLIQIIIKLNENKNKMFPSNILYNKSIHIYKCTYTYQIHETNLIKTIVSK